MNTHSLKSAAATALFATLALAGCKKAEEATPPVATESIPPVLTPAPQSAPAATVSVVSIDLGNSVDGQNRVASPMTTFGRNGVIIASVTTRTSDPAATVPGALGARWTYQDGQVVNEETQNVAFTGAGVTAFQIAKPDGWPAGNYRIDVLLDSQIVQSKEFTVQ